MHELLDSLLVGPLPTDLDLELGRWISVAEAIEGRWSEPIEQAIAVGFAADRLGYAFVGGYQAALRRLFPTLVGRPRVALCVTEVGGNHPRAIQTTLATTSGGLHVSGEKAFVTLANRAGLLVVAAREGQTDDGRPSIRLVAFDASSPGVALASNPPTRFCPEVPHARVTLDVNLDVAALIPGDGYPPIKAFRTIEDLHVHAAATGYLFGVARRFDWPAPAIERLAAEISGLVTLAALPPTAASTHVVLAGAIDVSRASREALAPHWSLVATDEAARWTRDQPLLSVASKAREARRTRAWQRLGDPALDKKTRGSGSVTKK